MTDKEKNEIVSYSVSSVHCALILPSVWYLMFNKKMNNILMADKLNAATLLSNKTFAISAAYFLFDILDMFVTNTVQVDFMFHHIACFICYYYIVPQPFLHYYSIRMLFFENSTPFLNIRKLLLLMKKQDKYKNLFNLVQALFYITFILSRLVYGIPCSISAIQYVYTSYKRNTLDYTLSGLFLTVSNISLNILNLVWSYSLTKRFIDGFKGLTSDKKTSTSDMKAK